jgi:predicted DNA-binding transcriptional regulator YafY
VAFDAGRDEWRTFRVDRIASAEPAGGRFAPREPPNAAAFVAAGVTTAPYRYQARVLVGAAASALASLVPPTVGVLTPVSDDSCMLATGSDSLDALAFHLTALGAEFSVLEPPELIDHLSSMAARMLRACANPEGTAPGPG